LPEKGYVQEQFRYAYTVLQVSVLHGAVQVFFGYIVLSSLFILRNKIEHVFILRAIIDEKNYFSRDFIYMDL